MKITNTMSSTGTYILPPPARADEDAAKSKSKENDIS